jgi:hypothetical protein
MAPDTIDRAFPALMDPSLLRQLCYVGGQWIGADDGPLPGVYSDTLAAQDAMREHTVKATGAIFVATALHAIAVGNMLPAFHLQDGGIPKPLMTICVDQTEFIVNKLRDRGTHQAYGVVTNAQDFMHVLRFYTERCRPA